LKWQVYRRSRVINWPHNNAKIRFNFPIRFFHNENPTKIKEIPIKVSNRHDGILKSPESDFPFDEFADHGLNFILRFWTSELTNQPKVLKSQLFYEIFKRFSKEDLEIPFPQRGIHIVSGMDKLKN